MNYVRSLSEQLMAFIRSPRGCSQKLRASSRGARDSHFFIYTPGKTAGRYRPTPCSVLKNLLPTGRGMMGL